MFINTKKNNIKNISYLIYKKIVLYSRNKIFYTNLEVPDTIDGRFDLIILHLFFIHTVLFQKGSLEEKIYDEVLNIMYKDSDDTYYHKFQLNTTTLTPFGGEEQPTQAGAVAGAGGSGTARGLL